MTPINKHTMLAALAVMTFSSAYGWEWPSWSSWIPTIHIVWKSHDTSKPEVEEGKEDNEQTTVENLNNDTLEAEVPPQEFDFHYEDLGIGLMPQEDPFLTTSYELQRDRLGRLDNRDPALAAGYFISLERANHARAMELIEDDTLSDNLRLDLLLNFPSAYTAKILRDLRENSAGKKIYHWGNFEASRILKLKHAYVHGEALPFIYITYILLSPPSKEQMSEVTFNKRVNCVMNALAALPAEEVARMLILEEVHAVFEMGANYPKCRNKIKSTYLTKVCEKQYDLKLPLPMIVSFIEGFNTNKKYALIAAEIMERQLRLHPETAKQLFHQITKKSFKQMEPFLSNNVKHMLSGDIAVDLIADDLQAHTNTKSSDVLQLSPTGKNKNN